jgi:hypothetical protein
VVADKQGARPSVREFERSSGLGYSDIQRFYAGRWTEALAANGFHFSRYRDWPDCPIEVVELPTEIKNLPNGG